MEVAKSGTRRRRVSLIRMSTAFPMPYENKNAFKITPSLSKNKRPLD